MASGDKEAFPVSGVIQSSSRIVISQQSPSSSPGASKPQSYKVFVLPPSQLNSLGLVTKNENGRVILTERAIESGISHSAVPKSSAAVSLAFIKTPGGIQIQSGQPSSSVKTSPKKGYVASAEGMKSGVKEVQMHKQFAKISTPGTNALGASSSRPLFARRSSNRRLLPQFTNYWKSSLEEKGYIRCPLRGCNYICLNFGEMTIHYYQCKGEPFASKYVCTPCNGRLKSEEDLKSHYIQTHSREGRIARRPQPKKVVELPKPEEKAKVWIRKRAYSKVHKVSWNIALEEKGYVNCFFKNCCFMALDLNQMIQHYGICNGTTAATSVVCPYCEACAECLEKLEAHVKKSHAGNPSVMQDVNPGVKIAISVSDSLPVPVPVQETNIASAVSSGINVGSSCVHQEKETVILSKKPSRPTPVKISAPVDKTVQTVVSMRDSLPKSLDQSHSRLYSSDTISKTTTTGSLSSSADTEVHCLFSMYEDFDEQRSLEREILLDSQVGSVGLSIKRECENTSTVLCKTYSKDNQRLVKDESYNERISSPLSALPCSFSDNISLCSDLSDIQIMRSSMSEGANNVMLVETKPEACVVEKLHEYMSRYDSHILNEDNVSFCRTSLNPKRQKEIFAESSISESSDPGGQENSAPHYELFQDAEPEYPQEYSLNSSTNKVVKSGDINLSRNDVDEGKQVTVEECLFSDTYASSSLVSYTEDVDEYIIPEIIEMTQYVVQTPVEVCNESVNKRIEKPNEKQEIASSQVPTNKIEIPVPAKVSDCENEEHNNNTSVEKMEKPRSIYSVDSVKYAEPQGCDELQKNVCSNIQITSQDNSSSVVETSFTDVQSIHPLYADTDELQNLDVPLITSVNEPKGNSNSIPNSQVIDVQHAECDLSEVNQELNLNKSVSRCLIISDIDKLTNSVENEDIKVLGKKNIIESESPDTPNEQLVPEDFNARLMCVVNFKSEDDIQLDVALNNNMLENATKDSKTRNQDSEISALDISGEGINESLKQYGLEHKKKLSENTISLPVSEISGQDLRDVKEKENTLELDQCSINTFVQSHSVIEQVCSGDVQHETKISEVLRNELQTVVTTTIQTALPLDSRSISLLSLENPAVQENQDESVCRGEEGKIDESQHESNQTLISYNSIIPSQIQKLDSEIPSEKRTTDEVLFEKIIQPTTTLPDTSSDTAKEVICIIADANLKEKSSQEKEQTLEIENSEAVCEFSQFHEIKNTDSNSIPVGVTAQLQMDSNEKDIAKINISNCEVLCYENESKPMITTGVDSNVRSQPALKEGIELKVEGNKSSYVELPGDKEHSGQVAISIEELESTNVKASETNLTLVSLTNIEAESKDDNLHVLNMFSETSFSKDGSLGSLEGQLNSVSESNALISANSNVVTADNTLPDDTTSSPLANLSKNSESHPKEDNRLESSNIAGNNLIVCAEQKFHNTQESIMEGKDKCFSAEKENMNINSKIRGVFCSSQCPRTEDLSKIVSTSIKEVNVDKLANIEKNERTIVISQHLQQSDELHDKSQKVDFSNLKMLDGDLISTIADNVQEVNKLCPPCEAPDSVNKANVLPTVVLSISGSLETDNHSTAEVVPIASASLSDVSEAREEKNSEIEDVSERELLSKGISDSKNDVGDNELPLAHEEPSESALQEFECVTPIDEEIKPESKEKLNEFSSEEQMDVTEELENEKISFAGDASCSHTSTISETKVLFSEESNVTEPLKSVHDDKECDSHGNLSNEINSSFSVISDEDNKLESSRISVNDLSPCSEQKRDNDKDSLPEDKDIAYEIENKTMNTDPATISDVISDSQIPTSEDASRNVCASTTEVNIVKMTNITENIERSAVVSQDLVVSDISQDKTGETDFNNLQKVGDLMSTATDDQQRVNNFSPPCELADSVNNMNVLPTAVPMISVSLESDSQSNVEVNLTDSTSLCNASKAAEEEYSETRNASERELVLKGIPEGKNDIGDDKTQVVDEISSETQSAVQESENVTPFVKEMKPESKEKLPEFSSEEQMDVTEELENEKISIPGGASCSDTSIVTESKVLFSEESNVTELVKSVHDDKECDSHGNLSNEINSSFSVISDEDNKLESSRISVNDLSPCSEQKRKNDKDSLLEGKDIAFMIENENMNTDPAKISDVISDSQIPTSEDSSRNVCASTTEVNINKTTHIENIERSGGLNQVPVESNTLQDKCEEADSDNLKNLDGDLITHATDGLEVNQFSPPSELTDSINKIKVLPLLSGSLECNNHSTAEVDPVPSTSLSDVSEVREEKYSEIEDVSEEELLSKEVSNSKNDVGDNELPLAHEEPSESALQEFECVSPPDEEMIPESKEKIQEFSSEEQMDVTEELENEKISFAGDASCSHTSTISETKVLFSEESNVKEPVKSMHDDKECDSHGNLSNEINSTFSVMSDEDNKLESSRISVNDLSPCSEQKCDNAKDSLLEDKDISFEVENMNINTDPPKISDVISDSQIPTSDDSSRNVCASTTEVNINKTTHIENIERSIGKNLVPVDTVQDKCEEADSDNLKNLDDDLIIHATDGLESNQFSPPSELTDSNKIKVLPLLSGSLECNNHSTAEVDPVPSTSLSDVSEVREEKYSEIEDVSEEEFLSKEVSDSKNDVGDNELPLAHEEPPESALEEFQCVTPPDEEMKPESKEKLPEFSSEEQMDVTEELENEKISIPGDASCSDTSIVTESKVLFSEESNVTELVKSVHDDKECDSHGNLSNEINSSFSVISDEDNKLESSRISVNDLSPCSEQKRKNDKDSLLEGKDIAFMIENENMNTDPAKISDVISDSQIPTSEDSSRNVCASTTEVNIVKMTNITENTERSTVVSQVNVNSDILEDNSEKANFSNLKKIDGEFITTPVDDQQKVNQFCTPCEVADSVNKIEDLPTTVPLISGCLQLSNDSNVQDDQVECTALSEESKTTEELCSLIEDVPERRLFLKQMPDSKQDIVENEAELCEDSLETKSALKVSECVTPFVVEDRTSVPNENYEFSTEEQMNVKIVTEELEDERISIHVEKEPLMAENGKLSSENHMPCVGEKHKESNASISAEICSEVKLNESVIFQGKTDIGGSSEAELIQQIDYTKEEVCVNREITVAESTLGKVKDNFCNACDEKNDMSCQKQDNVHTLIPLLLPLKKSDISSSVKESFISEETSIPSEYSLTESPKVFQVSDESCSQEHLKPASDIVPSIKERNESCVTGDSQEFGAEEPSILTSNVSIVADTKNLTGCDFTAKSSVLDYIKVQKEVCDGPDKENQEIIESKNENNLSALSVPTEENVSTKETTLGTEFSGTSIMESRALLDSEHVLEGTSEQYMSSSTNNEAPLFSESIALSENVKPLLLENLSIALAGEMEDSTEHTSSHQMLDANSYDSKAFSDNKKLLLPQEAFVETFEKYALDSPRTVSERSEKIYSTQDLQQILEGSDDSKNKLEDDEASRSMISREDALSNNENTATLKMEEGDTSQLCIKKEVVSSSESLKDTPKNFETELKTANSSCDKDSFQRKRRHSTDYSTKIEIGEERVNDGPPSKRKRSSSFCCSLTTNYEKNGKMCLLKTTLIKEAIKSNEQLEKLDTNTNLAASCADVTESYGPTEKQSCCQIANQNKVNNGEDIVLNEGTTVDNSTLRNDSETKCVFDVCEDSVSNTNISQQKRKIIDEINLPLETCVIQEDAETVTCVEAEDGSCNLEKKTELTCAEPPRKRRRRRSIEANLEVEAGAGRKSRRLSLRNKINLSEDSNSSNSSINSACEMVEGRRSRRGRRSRKVDDSVNTNEDSVSSTPQKENSEDPTFNQTKCESETPKILPYDSEQSIMSEDSVFSKTDSQNEFDSSLDIDDSASSTVGSIISDDSKDGVEDSQIGIDQDFDMSEIRTNYRGRGRGQRRRGNYRRRGGRRRGHWRGRGVQRVGGREEEGADNQGNTSIDPGNSSAQEEPTESSEIEPRKEDPNEEVQCGKCKEKMKRKSYDRHNNSIHNGLSWLEGEPPFDMSNEKLILSILWKIAKSRRLLTCENCGEAKRSAVGFWSHIAFCQRTAEEREALKVACDICGRYMIPASLKVHLQTHKVEMKPDPVLIETTRTQRAAAAKATSLLQEVMKEESQIEDKKDIRGSEEMVDLYQRLGPAKPSNAMIAKWKRLVAAKQQLECHFPGCTFKSTDMEVMVQHFVKCEKCPRRVYSCDLCNFQSKTEIEMQQHLGNEHLGTRDESDPEEAKGLKKMQPKLCNWKVCNKLMFLGKEMSGTSMGDKPFLPAVKWTLKFMKENYTNEDLFPDYHTRSKDWIPVPESEYSQYLPQTKESISFSTLAMRGEVVSTDSVTCNWRRMKMFESDIIDGVPTLFTGGPIWALAWATNPLNEIENEARDQFLAVSCHQRMGDTFKSNERYVGKGLIQLWNFGPLDNLERSTSNPKFALGIAHEYGAVWDLEWCPSGCYETTSTQEHLQRLGLLAAACSDGCVHIFSVCFTTSLNSEARYPIFRCKPVMTLIASENLSCELGGLPWSCLRLSWYKGKDHSVVAGGFNNGMVSLWNIKTESLLLRKQEDNTSILLPYKSFQAHLSCVTALSLSPQDEGRYLMTGSKDTTIKVWDMEDTSGPIPPVVRKGMVTDGIWLTHWLSSITSFDDVYSMGHCNTTLNPPRGYGFKLFPLLPQNSVTWSLSTTDWVNGIAQSTHAGELTAIFPHQLFLNVDTEKGNKDKRLILSYVELKDIVKESDEHTCESSCPVPCNKQQLDDLQTEIKSNKSTNPSEYEKVLFQPEEKDESEKGGLSFVIERNPRKGKKCVITPLSHQIHDSTSVSDLSFTNENGDEASDSLENIECISMLNQHEKRLLLTFKKDLERLNVTSRLKVTFPYYNNEKKKSNSNDTVKEYLMIVGSVKDDIKTDNSAQENGPAKAVQDDNTMFTIPSDDYEAVERKFGMIFCDFPADNVSAIPAASRLWTRKSETMKTAPVEIYPITSLNKVKWNPNCRSFLWLAAGYQCGLLRIPCISGMHNKEVEQLLRHAMRQKV